MGRKKDKKKSTRKPVYKCELCEDVDNTKPVVACDICDKWHHFSCLNIVSIGKKDPWICSKCKLLEVNKTNKPTQPTFSCQLCRRADNDEMILCDTCEQKYHFICVDLETCMENQPWNCLKCGDVVKSTFRPRPSISKENIPPLDSNNFPPLDSNNSPQKDQSNRRYVRPISEQHSQSSHRTFCIDPTDKYHQSSQYLYDRHQFERNTYKHYDFDRNSHLSRSASIQLSSQSQLSRRRIKVELDCLDEEMNLRSKWEREKELREQEYLERKYQLLRQGCDISERGSHVNRIRDTEKWVNESFNKKSDRKVDENSISISEFERRVHKLKFDNTSPKTPSYDKTVENIFKFEPSSMILKQNAEDTKPQLEVVNTTNKDQQPITGGLELKPITKDSTSTLSKSQIAARHVVGKKLSNFYGDPLEWTEWITSYEDSTRLCGFTDGENIIRLKECLKGKARDNVKHRLLTPSAAPKIIETLKMLYGRPELIVNIVLNNIKYIPAPKADKLETLVDYAMEVKNISATIEAAKLNYHLSNPTLVHEIVEKLPNNIKIDWARFKATQVNITLSTLADWLYSLAEVVCTVTVPSVSKKPAIKSEQKFPRKVSEHVNLHQPEKTKFNDQSKVRNEEKQDGISTHNSSQSQNQCKICSKGCREISECPTFKSYEISQRWQAIYTHKLCRKCLRRHGGYCRLTKPCGVNGCEYKHHPSLHDDQKHQKKEVPEVKAVVNYHNSSIPNVLFRIVPVIIYYRQLSIETYAYLDDGSSATLIEEELVNDLKLKGSPERLCLLWTSNVHRVEEGSCRLDIEISGQNEFSRRYQMRGVRTVKDLGLPTQSINKDSLVKKFSYLNRVPLIDYSDKTPRILIGLTDSRLSSQLKVIEGKPYEPIASKSRIGWTLHGATRVPDKSYNQTLSHHTIVICEHRLGSDEELHRLVKEYFTLENFGVQLKNAFNLRSKEDQRAVKILENYTKRIDGRFETALLWRYDSPVLHDSYPMAKRRLICLEKSKTKLIQIIDETIKDYVDKGYASKLTPSELSTPHSRVGYLPIFTVTYPKKPEKHRMVFDAAAKTNGISLNSMLLKGPDLINSLIDVLRRFRENRIAVCGDIKEMYHQIKIRDEDKHVQRFLWRNGNTKQEPDIYVLNVMTFGATCSPCSAQFIKDLNAREFSEQFPRAVTAIISNTYVDDMMDGEDNEEKAIQLVEHVKKIHEHGGFEIGKFLSNSTKVLEALGVRHDIENKNFAIDQTQNTERVLGMFWNTTLDYFTFSLKYTKINADVISGLRYPTKREILKTLMSIFDPLGLLSHFLIRLKILLQDIWRSKLEWDEKITKDEHQEAWSNWFKILPDVEKVQIPRLYSSIMTPESSIEMHIFVDASENAYSAVAYLRLEDNHGVDCVLVGSKARVAPIKYISIPRMELQAGVLGTRLMISIGTAQTFKIKRFYIWTDSKTLISWIRSDHKKYHQFVAHRIGEILENSEHSMWRWLPTNENVADEATKWTKIPSFELNCRWFRGPEFLRLPETCWPKESTLIEPDTSEDMKVRCLYSKLIISRIVDPTRFSNWNRMVRALAYVIRYVRILRAKIQKQKPLGDVLSQEELVKSRNLIFRQAQYDGYPDEMIILKRNQTLPDNKKRIISKSSSLFTWSPYLDKNGVIRVMGRIDAAKNIPYETKRPVILPKRNRITSLLVGCYHRIFHHRNHETVINEIKQRFSIPELRIILKMVRKNCQHCKVQNARPQPPELGDLPFARLAVGFRSYTYSGIDYFGPIKVLHGRSEPKRWGVLFTCLTTRAIHIEIAHSLDTDSCIMCLRNFIANHGHPKEMYSDNGTNMVGTDNELSRAVADIDVERLATEFTTCYSKWCFNPPTAAHQGGCWERLIRSVKTSLQAIMPTRKPTDEMLRNLLMEIQLIVNSRPLTFIPLDHEEDEALTPNHFLMGSSNGAKPFIQLDASGPILRSKWKEVQRLTDLFWKRFVKEYLPTLTRRTKWFQAVQPLKVGDLVLMMDEDTTRGNYPRAKVVEVMIGSNGRVRRARVQRADKKILLRPVTHLAKLDVEPSEHGGLVVGQDNNKTEGSVANDATASN